MTEQNTEKVRGNPIIPKAPIPSSVRMSMVPKPPDPIPKIVDGKEVEVGEEKTSLTTDVIVDDASDAELDAKPKGTVVIKVFENSPYEVEFSGKITGSEIDIAWKAMMKEYRVWKHSLIKKESGGV